MVKKYFRTWSCLLLSALILVTGLTFPVAAVSDSADGGMEIEASDFTATPRNLLSVSEREAGGIVFSNKSALTVQTTIKYTAKTEIRVDLDEYPVLTLVMGNCLCQYDAFYTLKGSGETHYLNDNDTADWRWAGNYALNLTELHGWSGEQTIVLTMEYILWEANPAEAGAITVEVKKLAFEPVRHFSLSELYGDDMVLQQNAPICITGTGDAQTALSATLKGKSGYTETAETIIGADGTFTLQFSPLTGGYEAYTLTVSDGNAATILENIVIGEVWLAGGQSNMEYRLKWTVEGTEMTEDDADDPYLRCNRFGEGGGWLMGDDPDAIALANAVGYYFAKTLREELDVPVGFINTARGSTSIYDWIDDGAYTDTALKTYATNRTGTLSTRYDTLIAPLAGFRLRGLIWYQGEANVGDEADRYGQALSLLRDSWGELFGFDAGTMPLVVSHLAPYCYPVPDVNALPAFAAELSEAIAGMTGPVTQVTIYDLPVEYETPASGAPVDPIHPSRKAEVGARMAKAALNLLYNTDSESGAPVFKSFEVRDGALYVTFDCVGTGLAVSAGDTLHGFSICGKDKVFLPADAKIVSSDTVRLTSDYVKEPFGASYAYTAFNGSANLVNTVGNKIYLPAVPFVTENAENGSFFRIREWIYCDSEQIWRANSSEAGYEAAWTSESGDISYSTTEKWGGIACLRLAYTADADGLITLTPNVSSSLGNTDAGTNYRKYGALLLRVRSLSGSITLKEVRLGNEAVAIDAAVGTEWTTVNVDISEIKNRANVSSISFIFSDEAGKSGVLYLDEISFGTDADAYAPYAEPSATEEPSPTGNTGEEGLPETVKILLVILGCSVLCSILLLAGVGIYSNCKRKTK